MRTHRAKSAHLRRVYSAYIFDSYPLPLLRRLTVGAAIEKIFFYFSKHRFNSSSFHSVFLISFYLFSFYTRLITIWIYFISLRIMASIQFLDFIFPILNFDSYFFRLVFTRINFDLFQHCLFYALTLQLFISLTLLLVINKHLCL